MTMKSNLTEFVTKCIALRNSSALPIGTSELLRLLLSCDYDLYETLYHFSRIKEYTQDDLAALLSVVPPSQPLHDLSLNSIHAMIPRWTATKYHTAPIQEVLEDIRAKILSHLIGVHVYHSNLNPRNPKSPDYPYMLLISKEQSVFLDINRRRSFKYTYTDSKSGQGGNCKCIM